MKRRVRAEVNIFIVITESITRRYGQRTLKTYKCVNKNIFKTKKIELVLKFLNFFANRKTLFPVSSDFKLYDKSFLSTNL